MIKIISLISILILINFSIWNLLSAVNPVSAISQQTAAIAGLSTALRKVKIENPGENILKAVVSASSQTQLSKELIVALMWTESRFNHKAVSNMGYQGLMQIPWKIPFQNAHILIGAEILKEKFVITRGDLRSAVMLYKGYNLADKRGQEQADKVLNLTRRLKENI